MSDETLQVDAHSEECQETPCWTFLSNHALVMMCLVDDPTTRMRDIAMQVGITERAVQRILTELEESGYLQRHREGRRNFYIVDLTQPMRHPMIQKTRVADLLRLRLRSEEFPSNGTTAPEATDTRRRNKSKAANGTSFGRRRGPVPRAAMLEESAETFVDNKHSDQSHAHNGHAPATQRRRGRRATSRTA